ncbi:MAG TPA: hypothetical protein DCQ15_07370 [Chitinophagaceae bacterium]|nr:hypothetical protein [Chitinophagaceae bacterium]
MVEVKTKRKLLLIQQKTKYFFSPIKQLAMNGKKGLGLLLAGIAAYGIYKYNKMNAAEKKQLKDKVKAKGQKIYEEYVPQDVKDLLAKAKPATAQENN